MKRITDSFLPNILFYVNAAELAVKEAFYIAIVEVPVLGSDS